MTSATATAMGNAAAAGLLLCRLLLAPRPPNLAGEIILCFRRGEGGEPNPGRCPLPGRLSPPRGQLLSSP